MQQVFTFAPQDQPGVVLGWDVDTGRSIANEMVKTTLVPVDKLNVQEYMGGLDPEAVANADLEEPILVVTRKLPDGEVCHCMIDGNHRMARHAQLGHETCPAKVLPLYLSRVIELPSDVALRIHLAAEAQQ